MTLSRIGRFIIWAAFALLVICYAIIKLTGDGPPPKPGEKGESKLVMEMPEDNVVPPVSHSPIEQWIAWHGVTIKRGDPVKECEDCHDKKKFCRVCHNYSR